MFDFNLLKELSVAVAPSGFESHVREIIFSRLREYGIRHSVSPDGSVAAVIPSKNNSYGKLMLQAHMDEVGFMVKSHTDEGFLKISPLGIRDSRLLTGRRVTVIGKNGPLCGYIGAIPVHLSKGDKKIPSYSDLYVDIGAVSKSEAESLAPIGCGGCFSDDFLLFGSGNSYVKSKALSARASVAILLAAAEAFADGSLPYDLYFAFTPRGKLSLSGGASLYSRIKPDGVISVYGADIAKDVSIKDVSGIALPYLEEKYAFDRSLTSQLRENLPQEITLWEKAPTEAEAETEFDIIRLKAAGARVAAIKLPVKNRNTACEVMCMDTVKQACELLCTALPSLRL